MKLFYKPGACSMATHIILNELDIPFELEKTDTDAAVTVSGIDFRSISPNGYVPALQTNDGNIITENPAILQYLVDGATDSKLAPPNGTLERTRLHELLNFLSAELHKAYSPFFSKIELDASAKEAAQKTLSRRVGAMQDRLADGREFLLGDTFGVADAYAFVLLSWSPVIGFDLRPWPEVAAYVKRLRRRPAIIRALQAEGLLDERVAS